MARAEAIAVIDIGKSNAKLALVDRESLAAVAVRTQANTVVSTGPFPHYDVDSLWQWIVQELRAFAGIAEIGAISVTTHGACFVLLSGDRLALPVIDYEYAALEDVRADYAALRGPFAETLSPELPNGLNAGRQLYWLSRRYPAEFARVDCILPYPQYWAWRLSGGKASEATSLGCHTDLWNPRAATFSQLAIRGGWDRLFPAVVPPWHVVGTLRPELSAATGIATECRIVAGIHDSNASLLPYLLVRAPPFTVASTGTWMVAFAVGGNVGHLDETRDCLANVDAFGRPVPSARFMAGREFDILAGDGVADAADIERVVARGIMALPTFAPGTGPYGASAGRWSVDPASLTPGEQAAAASLYAALVATRCFDLVAAGGPVIVEGPFARNAVFLAALAALVPGSVIARPDATGTTEGAALLALGPETRPPMRDPAPVLPLVVDLSAYAARWRAAAEHG